jgi:hypothetical protein
MAGNNHVFNRVHTSQVKQGKHRELKNFEKWKYREF